MNKATLNIKFKPVDMGFIKEILESDKPVSHIILEGENEQVEMMGRSHKPGEGTTTGEAILGIDTGDSESESVKSLVYGSGDSQVVLGHDEIMNMGREDIIHHLKAIDPNGVYSDEDAMAEFGEIMPTEDGRNILLKWLDEEGEVVESSGRKTHACTQCGNKDAYYREFGADTSFNEVLEVCPDCGRIE